MERFVADTARDQQRLSTLILGAFIKRHETNMLPNAC